MLGATLCLWVGNTSQHATESIQTHPMHHSYQTARRISEGRWDDDSGEKPRPFHRSLPCEASNSPAHWFGHCCLGPPGGCYPNCLSCCQSVWTLQTSAIAWYIMPWYGADIPDGPVHVLLLHCGYVSSGHPHPHLLTVFVPLSTNRLFSPSYTHLAWLSCTVGDITK